MKPVVVVHERVDAVLGRQGGLLLANVVVAQVVVAEPPGEQWLLMPDEVGLSSSNVGPFGEPGPPPAIVLRDRMELRQVEGERRDAPRSP